MKFLILMCMFVTFTAFSQVKNTEHTYKLSKTTLGTKAHIDQVSWLVGSWVGTAFGKKIEQVWNPVSAGTMVGFFKLFDEEKGVDFYELMLIKQVGDSLSLLVKHFNSDFHSWEEKTDYIEFKLVSISKDEIHFSGLSFYKRNDSLIDAYIAFRMKDKSLVEKKLVYNRN